MNNHKIQFSWIKVARAMVTGIMLSPVFVLFWFVINGLMALAALGVCELLKLILG